MAWRSVIMMAFLVITLVACGLVPFVDAQRGGGGLRASSGKFGSQNHLQKPQYRPVYGYNNKPNTNSGNWALSSGSTSDHTAVLFMVAVPVILVVAWCTFN